MIKRFTWPVFFLLLGAISILGQTVILREITTLFYGNDLFYGLGLGVWLLFTGLGSLLIPKLIVHLDNGRGKNTPWGLNLKKIVWSDPPALVDL